MKIKFLAVLLVFASVANAEKDFEKMTTKEQENRPIFTRVEGFPVPTATYTQIHNQEKNKKKTFSDAEIMAMSDFCVQRKIADNFLNDGTTLTELRTIACNKLRRISRKIGK